MVYSSLYEIGAAMGLFQAKNYADEFWGALEGKKGELPQTDGDTGGPGAEEIQEQTRDFVLKRLAQEMKGHPMTDFVAHLLGHMGLDRIAIFQESFLTLHSR